MAKQQCVCSLPLHDEEKLGVNISSAAPGKHSSSESPLWFYARIRALVLGFDFCETILELQGSSLINSAAGNAYAFDTVMRHVCVHARVFRWIAAITTNCSMCFCSCLTRAEKHKMCACHRLPSALTAPRRLDQSSPNSLVPHRRLPVSWESNQVVSLQGSPAKIMCSFPFSCSSPVCGIWDLTLKHFPEGS